MSLAAFDLQAPFQPAGDQPKAIAELSQTLTPTDAQTPRYMYALGIAYAEAGDYALAKRYLREAGQRAAPLGQDQLLSQIATSLRKLEERAGR